MRKVASLLAEALSQLREHCLYPTTLVYQRARPRLLLTIFLAFLELVERKQVRFPLAEPPSGVRTSVVPVAQDPCLCPFEQPLSYQPLVGIGGSEAETDGHPVSANTQVCSEAAEGLLVHLHRLEAYGVLLGQDAAAIGPSEPTYGNWEGAYQREQRIEPNLLVQQMRLQSLLSDPQISCLTRESSVVHPLQTWEEFSLVAPEARKEILLGVEAEEPARDLDDGQDLRVGGHSLGSTLAQLRFSFKSVINEAEDGADEDVTLHERRPPSPSAGLDTTERKVSRSAFNLFNCSEKLAHGAIYASKDRFKC